MDNELNSVIEDAVKTPIQNIRLLNRDTNSSECIVGLGIGVTLEVEVKTEIFEDSEFHYFVKIHFEENVGRVKRERIMKRVRGVLGDVYGDFLKDGSLAFSGTDTKSTTFSLTDKEMMEISDFEETIGNVVIKDVKLRHPETMKNDLDEVVNFCGVDIETASDVYFSASQED